MRTRWRWGLAAIACALLAMTIAMAILRPIVTARPPRPLARRADDALYQAADPQRPPPPTPAALEESVPGTGSTDPPEGYPVKGNRRSGIYHLPGDLAYERTAPSLFFRSAAAAERAGFRHALR